MLHLRALLLFLLPNLLSAQPFTRQDTLRGSITPERAWWDLKFYDLHVEFDIAGKKLRGDNTISFEALQQGSTMQIDLQPPLEITSVQHRGKTIPQTREGNVYWIRFPQPISKGAKESIHIQYGGTPIEAIRPPWDGGITWNKDAQGNPFVASSCQGLGASAWWPCKDHMYDEPDSMLIRITTPSYLRDVSNGRLRHIDYHPDGRRTFHWFVSNPINNYGVNANIADYQHWSDTLHGEKGILDLDFWVLPENFSKAKTHFQDVYRTLRALEHWFGPYPFYEDGYKLVDVPYLGMEHQSSVTYGNGYQMGYKGTDLSGTGWGLKWDFIIVHETAHEWWANNITYKDMADMWIHESFANYAESLFTEYFYGSKAASEYVIGTRKKIENKSPIIAHYNVNESGPIDMYYKGGNMLHTLRQWMNDDEKFRQMLRGMQRDFYHQTVTTQQIEDYMATFAGLKLNVFFNQYLRDTRIPTLTYQLNGKKATYQYTNTVDGFDMPVRVRINDGEWQLIHPLAKAQTLKHPEKIVSFDIDPNYYIFSRPVSK